MVVRTMRKESRGFDRDRRVEKRRRAEFVGSREDSVVREEDASGGREGNSGFDSAAAASWRAFWRRRCGRSWATLGGLFEIEVSSEFGDPLGRVVASIAEDVNAVNLALALVGSRKALYKKYPVRKRGAADSDAERVDDAAVRVRRAEGPTKVEGVRKHFEHMLSSALYLLAPGDGNRIIIAHFPSVLERTSPVNYSSAPL